MRGVGGSVRRKRGGDPRRREAAANGPRRWRRRSRFTSLEEIQDGAHHGIAHASHFQIPPPHRGTGGKRFYNSTVRGASVGRGYEKTEVAWAEVRSGA